MVQQAKLPEAVYGCANSFCAEQTSYPPDMLYWWAGSEHGYPPGFYCRESEGCQDQLLFAYYGDRTDATSDPDGMVGPTLKEELARRDAAPDMLEALLRMMDRDGCLSTCAHDPPYRESHTLRCDKMRAAIAKAKHKEDA